MHSFLKLSRTLKELLHCVKSVRIRSYSGQYFPTFGLKRELYGVSLRIQSKCGKIRTRITPNTDAFRARLLSMILIFTCHMYLLNDNLRVSYMDEIGSPPDRAKKSIGSPPVLAKKSNCPFTWFGKILNSSTNIALSYMVPYRVTYNPGRDIWSGVEKSSKLDRKRKVLYLLLRVFDCCCQTLSSGGDTGR